MSPRGMIVIVLALVCGLSAVFLVQAIRKPVAVPTIDRTPVVFAIEDVKTGEMVTEKGVEIRQIPSEQVPEDAIRKISDAIDRAAKATVDKGDMLRELKLADKGAGRGMAALIKPGMLAAVIQTPSFSASMGGFLLPGDRVNINLTPSAGPGGPEAPRILLEDVKVLAVDKNVNQPAANKINPEETRFVTVEVTPDDALRLDQGQSQGTLTLKLRNPGDKAKGLARAMPQPIVQAPPPPPANPEPPALDTQIQAGMRAFTIDLDKFSATLAGHLSSGSRVDVLFTAPTDKEDKDLTGGGSTITLLKDIKILEVQAKDDKPKEVNLPVAPANPNGAVPNIPLLAKPEPGDSRYVTLEVTPAQAQALDLGQLVGKLHLSLRSALDRSPDWGRDRPLRFLAGLDGDDAEAAEIAEVARERAPDSPLRPFLAHQFGMVPVRRKEAPTGPVQPRVVAEVQVRTLRGTRSGADTWTLFESTPRSTPTPSRTPGRARDLGQRDLASQ